jgi:hypothetical protein
VEGEVRIRRIGGRQHIWIVTLALSLPGPPPSPAGIPITAHDALLDLEVVASLRLGVPQPRPSASVA